MSKIKAVTVHGGHNPAGKIACGASDYIDESKEDRIITKKVIRLLKKNWKMGIILKKWHIWADIICYTI